MPHRKPILDALQVYLRKFPEEEAVVLQMRNFIEENTDCFCRSHISGHMTGSSWLLNPQKDKVLLTHHKKLGKWLQCGGHADGDSNIWQVALKEASEESGITGISFLSMEIFDIDIHEIPEYKTVPAHLHYDVRFLMQAPTENFIISPESNNLKWFDRNSLHQLIEEGKLSASLKRMVLKEELFNSHHSAK